MNIRVAGILALVLLTGWARTPAQAAPGDAGRRAASSPFGLPWSTLAAPVIPGCEKVLTPEVLQELQLSLVDPEVLYEEWRQAHPHMIEAPPTIECRHLAWLSYHPVKSVVQKMLDALEPFPVPLAASVGANIDVANGVSAYQGEVQLAINPNNPLQIVAGANSFYRDPTAACLSPTGGSANTYGTQALYGSTDGGQTWTYQCAPWPSSLTGGVSGAVAWFGSDPAMAWDANGSAYAVYMLISQNSSGTASGAAIVIAKSTNSGTSWSNLGTIVNHISNTSLFDDKEMVAIDRTSGQARSHTNRIYVIWDENNGERVAYSDNGTTWTTVVLSASGDIGGNLAIASDGTVYAVWNKYSQTGGVGTGDRIVFSKSTDGGATWSSAVQISQNNLASFGTNNAPPAQDNRKINCFASIDVNNNPNSAYYGRIYVVYNDFPSGTGSGTDVNVYLRYSTDGGSTWSSAVKVNDDTGTATQFFPWMGVDQTDGTVNVSWYDTRSDTNNRKTQVYYARSSNGGASFEPNILVEDSGINFRNNVSYSDLNTTDNASRNANQYGDYSGMAAINRKAFSLWTDSRNYFPSADTVSPTRAEDVATVTITNCTAPASFSAPTLACGTNQINLTWSAPSSWGTNATGGTYEVDRFTDAACTQNKVILATGLTSTSYSDTTASQGVTYYYEVIATNNCPGTALTPMSVATSCSAAINCTFCTPPAVPGSVTATASAPNQITVSWGAVSGALSYNVYRASGACPGGSYTLIGAVNSPATSYVDTTVTGGLTYSYEVTSMAACESAQSSCWSVQATGICSTPPTFSGLSSASASSGGVCGVDLSWSAATSNCGGSITYTIYRSTSSGFTPGLAYRVATGVGATAWKDTASLASNTTYYYIVRAADSLAGMEDSNTVQKSATTGSSCTTGPSDVQAFTVTSTGAAGGTTGQNLLQWWNPPSGPSGVTITITYRTDTYPTSPTDPLASTLLSSRSVTYGAVDSFTHTGLTNGTTYYYTLWVKR